MNSNKIIVIKQCDKNPCLLCDYKNCGDKPCEIKHNWILKGSDYLENEYDYSSSY